MMTPAPMPWEKKEQSAQVPFMITQAQKEALRQKGFDDDQIAHMTPEKAHQLLGITPAQSY
ncbi:hypothetical protein HAP48_0031975 [Bradyrhizobium septentrionale]|nr:hypothetical protein [Bradyrhizobium septentrionale]UGY13192.1 hypothetical protein HAP48_0031975 [Bradyrhizobium septentrionale]UGY21811.1 hypothetical protein HU675_0027795 [Bradyrhizobium septentrionale]